MTLQSMTNNLLRFVPGLNPTIVESIIQDSYLQLASMEWYQLNITRILTTTPPYTVGKVTIDSSGVVTPHNGATFNATFVGRYLRLYYSDTFFEITSFISPDIVIQGWTGLDITTPTTYSIFKHTYSLSPDFKHIRSLHYNTTLTKRSLTFLNRLDPSRITTGTPTMWAYSGMDGSGNIQIELFPVPDSTYPIRCRGKRKVATLAPTDSPILQESLIENHALIQCYRIKAQLEPRQGWEERLSEQSTLFQSILATAREEDFLLGDTEDRVKDKMGERLENLSDTFWVARDDMID